VNIRVKKWIKSTAIVLLLLFSFAGGQKTLRGGEGDQGAAGMVQAGVLAQVGEQSIDADYLQSYLSIRPQPPHAQVTTETIRQRLEELIVSEVLYREALRLQLDRRPQVRWQIQQLLAQQLLEEKINQPIRQKKITDAELRAYYKKNSQEFNRPAQVRLADIFIAVDPGLTAQKKQEFKEYAGQILAAAKKIEAKASGFGDLIEKYSDIHPNYPKGSTGFFDSSGAPVGLEVQLAREALKIKKVGQIHDRLIETPLGYHVVMLVGRRAAVHKPFGQVNEPIRKRIYRERLAQARDNYIQSLKAKSKITINSEVVAAIAKTTKKTGEASPFSVGP
jgi:parvulin-like peptidyl-prolyl cis-trans isomerase-like protein